MPPGSPVTVTVDLTKFDAWIEHARSAARDVGNDVGKAASKLAPGMTEDFRANLPSYLSDVGLGRRSGAMASETSVTVVRVVKTPEGAILTLRIEGPPYVMIHETGGVISAKAGKYLKVPFVGGSAATGARGSMVTGTAYSLSEGSPTNVRTTKSFAGGGFFVMKFGRGGKALRVPLLMEKFSAAEGRLSPRRLIREEYKERFRQVSKLKASASEKSAARDALTKAMKEELDEAPAEAFPVASLRKQVTMPRRPWLSRAVQHFQSKLDTTVEGVEVSYLSNKFDFNLRWDGK